MENQESKCAAVPDAPMADIPNPVTGQTIAHLRSIPLHTVAIRLLRCTNAFTGLSRVWQTLVIGHVWPFPLVVVLWARQDLNLQPTDYESAALTRLSYGPAG